MIEGEIKRYLRDNNSIRISRSIKDLAYKTLKLKEELSIEGKEPSNKDVADILGVIVEDGEISFDDDTYNKTGSLIREIVDASGYNTKFDGKKISLFNSIKKTDKRSRNWLLFRAFNKTNN